MVAKKWSHRACFDAFGAIPRNVRWSWSGRSENGATVAVTLWRDRFENQGRIYRSWQDDVPAEWRSRPGFVELIDNLAHAEDELGGIVRVVVAEPVDPEARPRTIARCWPQPGLVMRVKQLDRNEGTFVLERLDT